MNVHRPYDLSDRETAELFVLRFRDQAFDAIYKVWMQRRAEGMTQKDIAQKIGRDPAWVSRALSGPGNWTLKTIGELAYALNASMDIRGVATEKLPLVNEDIYSRVQS